MDATETVGVLFGGPGPEHDVSVLTGLQAERCLNDNGTRAIGIYWSKGGEFYDVGFSDLIDEAVARPAYRPVLAGADGRLLHSAASVAAKLA